MRRDRALLRQDGDGPGGAWPLVCVMILLERAGLLPIDSGIARHGTGAGLWPLISVLKEMLSAPAFPHSGPASDSLLGRDR